MEARTEFAHLDDLDATSLHMEREAILALAPKGDFNLLGDDDLTRLWAVMRALRRKAATPTTRRSRAPAGPKKIEDLA